MLGIGFCARDWLGRIVLAGAAHSTASSALVAELLAARCAIEEVLNLNWAGSLILEGDSATVVAWWRVRLSHARSSRYPSDYSRGNIHMVLVPREANALADNLANYGKAESCMVF